MPHSEPEYRRLLKLAAALRAAADEVHTAAVRGTPSVNAAWIADHIAGIAEVRRAWGAYTGCADDTKIANTIFAVCEALDALDADAKHLTATLGV